MPDSTDYQQPVPRQVVVVAVFGAALALLVAWQTDLPLSPTSLHVPAFLAGTLGTAVVALFVHGTRPGNATRWFIANTRWGRLVAIAVTIGLLVFFSSVHQTPYAAELVAAILGASVGSLARLAVI